MGSQQGGWGPGPRKQRSHRRAGCHPVRGRMHPPFPEAPFVLPACSGIFLRAHQVLSSRILLVLCWLFPCASWSLSSTHFSKPHACLMASWKVSWPGPFAVCGSFVLTSGWTLWEMVQSEVCHLSQLARCGLCLAEAAHICVRKGCHQTGS